MPQGNTLIRRYAGALVGQARVSVVSDGVGVVLSIGALGRGFGVSTCRCAGPGYLHVGAVSVHRCAGSAHRCINALSRCSSCIECDAGFSNLSTAALPGWLHDEQAHYQRIRHNALLEFRILVSRVGLQR